MEGHQKTGQTGGFSGHGNSPSQKRSQARRIARIPKFGGNIPCWKVSGFLPPPPNNNIKNIKKHTHTHKQHKLRDCKWKGLRYFPGYTSPTSIHQSIPPSLGLSFNQIDRETLVFCPFRPAKESTQSTWNQVIQFTFTWWLLRTWPFWDGEVICDPFKWLYKWPPNRGWSWVTAWITW